VSGVEFDNEVKELLISEAAKDERALAITWLVTRIDEELPEELANFVLELFRAADIAAVVRESFGVDVEEMPTVLQRSYDILQEKITQGEA